MKNPCIVDEIYVYRKTRFDFIITNKNIKNIKL